MKYYLSIMVGFLSCINSYARDNYIPHDNQPLSMLIHDDCLINTYSNMDYSMIRQHSIMKFHYNDSTTELITNENIPEFAYSIAENSQYIFVGGTTGLGVFDKRNGKWEKWYTNTVNAVTASDSSVWIGTMSGVVEIDRTGKAVRKLAKKTGLNGDKVYSLYLDNSKLYIGTYRNGRGTFKERREDMLGTGLNTYDLFTSKTSNVALPIKKGDIVLDIYPVIDKPNTVRVVAGCWYVTVFDYNTIDGKILKKANRNHHIESVLTKCGKDIHSVVCDNLLKYMMKVGLDKWPGGGEPCPIAAEFVDITYNRKDHSLLDQLLTKMNPDERALGIAGLKEIATDRSNTYLINALSDENCSVVTEAARCLGDRKVLSAIPDLRKVLKLHENQKSFFALKALLIMEPGIAKEIIGSVDVYEYNLLGSVVKICNIKKPIIELANDPNEREIVRARAKQILDNAKY